ncbi:MAG TPA: glycosyltransferase family A protein [Thermoleophilaceae bacterium]
MAGPRISVVIPVCNGERFLAEAIESVLAQSRAPFELIVVDDGSEDGSAAVAERFSEVDLIRTEHRGVSVARNTGVEHSGGDLIAFLDADDLMKPDRLERQGAVLAERPDLAFVLARAELVVEDGVELPVFITARTAPMAGDHDPYYAMTVLIRREAFDRVGPFDPGLRLGQDGDWMMRAFDSGLSYEFMEEQLTVRRFHGANATYDTEGARRASFEILKRRAARHRSAGSG